MAIFITICILTVLLGLSTVIIGYHLLFHNIRKGLVHTSNIGFFTPPPIYIPNQRLDFEEIILRFKYVPDERHSEERMVYQIEQQMGRTLLEYAKKYMKVESWETDRDLFYNEKQVRASIFIAKKPEDY